MQPRSSILRHARKLLLAGLLLAVLAVLLHAGRHVLGFPPPPPAGPRLFDPRLNTRPSGFTNAEILGAIGHSSSPAAIRGMTITQFRAWLAAEQAAGRHYDMGHVVPFHQFRTMYMLNERYFTTADYRAFTLGNLYVQPRGPNRSAGSITGGAFVNPSIPVNLANPRFTGGTPFDPPPGGRGRLIIDPRGNRMTFTVEPRR